MRFLDSPESKEDVRGYIAVINKCKRAYQSVRKLKLLSHSALKVYLGPEEKIACAWLSHTHTFFFFAENR